MPSPATSGVGSRGTRAPTRARRAPTENDARPFFDPSRDPRDDPLRFLLCARPGKVPVAAGEVDDDPARMRLKRGRAYREMAMKWCFRAGRPIADEGDSGDELHAVAGEDGVLRFNRAETENGASRAPAETGDQMTAGSATGATGALGDGGAAKGSDQPHAPHGALDLARAANVGLSAAAFRRLVARARKAGTVPTRADLKRASRRAEERRAREMERAERLAEARE